MSENILAKGFRVFVEDRNNLLHRYMFEKHQGHKTSLHEANRHRQVPKNGRDDTNDAHKIIMLKNKLIKIGEKDDVKSGALCEKEVRVGDNKLQGSVFDYMTILIAEIDAFEKLLHEHYHVAVKDDEKLLTQEIITCVKNDALLPEAINYHILSTCIMLHYVNEAYDTYLSNPEVREHWKAFESKSDDLLNTLSKATRDYLLFPWSTRRPLAHAIEESFRLSRQTKNLIHLRKIKEKYLIPLKVFCQESLYIQPGETVAINIMTPQQTSNIAAMVATTPPARYMSEAGFSSEGGGFPPPIKRQRLEDVIQTGETLPEETVVTETLGTCAFVK